MLETDGRSGIFPCYAESMEEKASGWKGCASSVSNSYMMMIIKEMVLIPNSPKKERAW